MDKSHGQISWREGRGSFARVIRGFSSSAMRAMAFGAVPAISWIIREALEDERKQAYQRAIREADEGKDAASSDG